MSNGLSAGLKPVTVENFVFAESDKFFGNFVRQGGFGKLVHNREPASVDNQAVIRLNRDTIYSNGVFDLEAGPVTVKLPNAGNRFMSLIGVSEDHYVPLVSYGGTSVFSQDKVGTRYVAVLIRTFVDPNDPADMAQAHALQDAIVVTQPGGPGTFEVAQWDTEEESKIRDALAVLGSTLPNFDGAFGARGQTDPVRHLIGTATGWGGNPTKDAFYVGGAPAKNDGKARYTMHLENVPVDGFWSVSVYDGKGYFQKNPAGVYSLNSVTAKKSADGSVDILFGGDGTEPNSIPTPPGWNYVLRLYRPRPEVISGAWKMPELQAVN